MVLDYACKHIVAMFNHFVIWKTLKYYYFVTQTYYTSVYPFFYKYYIKIVLFGFKHLKHRSQSLKTPTNPLQYILNSGSGNDAATYNSMCVFTIFTYKNWAILSLSPP